MARFHEKTTQYRTQQKIISRCKQQVILSLKSDLFHNFWVYILNEKENFPAPFWKISTFHVYADPYQHTRTF
jgi:hypothetical protein